MDMEMLAFVLSGGFGLLTLVLGIIGRNIAQEIRGIRLDLQQFKLHVERRLTTTEVQLENLNRQTKK